jgi:hypothetical protein
MSLLLSPAGRAIALAIGLLASHWWAFTKGESSAANRALVADLRQQVAQKDIDLKAAQHVADVSAKAAAESARIAASNQKIIEEFRNAVAGRKGKDGACRLGADDIRRLQRIE